MVGTALAIVGLGLFLLGVIGGVLVVPTVVGLYLIGVLGTPRPKPLSLVDPGGELDGRRLEKSLDRIVEQSRKRLPDELAAKVESIRTTIVELLPSLRQ